MENKKEKLMQSETKIALIATGLSLLSVICLYLIAYSNQITNLGGILGGIFGGIIGGIIGGILGGFFGVIFGVIFGGIFGGFLGVIFGDISGGIFGDIFGHIFGGIFGGILGVIIFRGMDADESKKGFIAPAQISLLSIVFLLPLVALIVPLSRYHNQNQLKRDQRIKEVLQITKQEDGIEILLPAEYAQEHFYLEKVLSVVWKEKKSWRAIAILCQDGNRYWYRAKLSFPEPEKETDRELILFFDHAWEDLKISVPVAIPLAIP